MKIEYILEMYEWLITDRKGLQAIYDKANHLIQCGITESTIEQFNNIRNVDYGYQTNL